MLAFPLGGRNLTRYISRNLVEKAKKAQNRRRIMSKFWAAPEVVPKGPPSGIADKEIRIHHNVPGMARAF